MTAATYARSEQKLTGRYGLHVVDFIYLTPSVPLFKEKRKILKEGLRPSKNAPGFLRGKNLATTEAQAREGAGGEDYLTAERKQNQADDASTLW